jgi:DNA-binding NarL/FixJ family response regulator
MSEERYRVLIADDHRPTREEVRFALEEDQRFEVCAEAADAAGAVDGAVRERPEVCLLDVHMPGGGVAATREIATRLPDTKIVMLTMSDEDRDLLGALRAGASGYLLKDVDPRSLPRVLAAVCEGETALPRSLVGRVTDAVRDRSAHRREVLSQSAGENLTSREWQVLELLQRGLTTAQIAKRLVLSSVTVRTHVNSIVRKFGASDRDDLLRRLNEQR